jgi:hypothetical protein
MRYAEEITLVLSIAVLDLVIHGWATMKSFGSIVPLIAMAGFGLWAFCLMSWAIISLKDEVRLSKTLLASVMVLCAAAVIL